MPCICRTNQYFRNSSWHYARHDCWIMRTHQEPPALPLRRLVSLILLATRSVVRIYSDLQIYDFLWAILLFNEVQITYTVRFWKGGKSCLHIIPCTCAITSTVSVVIPLFFTALKTNSFSSFAVVIPNACGQRSPWSPEKNRYRCESHTKILPLCCVIIENQSWHSFDDPLLNFPIPSLNDGYMSILILFSFLLTRAFTVVIDVHASLLRLLLESVSTIKMGRSYLCKPYLQLTCFITMTCVENTNPQH